MPTMAKAALPLLGILALAAILVVVLGSGKDEGLTVEAGMGEAPVSRSGVPAIDAAAPAEFETATFALG